MFLTIEKHHKSTKSIQALCSWRHSRLRLNQICLFKFDLVVELGCARKTKREINFSTYRKYENIQLNENWQLALMHIIFHKDLAFTVFVWQQQKSFNLSPLPHYFYFLLCWKWFLGGCDWRFSSSPYPALHSLRMIFLGVGIQKVSNFYWDLAQ